MIYAVIAVHDRKQFTERFLQALKQQTVQEIVVVIVDDGSTDGTANMVQQYYSTAIILRGSGNWWWGGSMRRGIDYVRTVAQPGDFVLCANNDQIAERNALEMLLHTSKKYHRALVGSISKEYTNHAKLFDSAYTIDWSMHKHHPVPLADHGDYSGNIDVLTCRFTLCPIEFFQQVNFDDKRFPHYLSDYDLFVQAKYHGFRLILCYDSVIYDVGGISGTEHKGMMTIKQLFNNMFSIRSHNNVIFMLHWFWKDCPNFFYKIKLTLLLFYYYLYLFIKALFFTWFGIDIKLPHRNNT